MPVQGRLYFHAQGEPAMSLKAFAVLGELLRLRHMHLKQSRPGLETGRRRALG